MTALRYYHIAYQLCESIYYVAWTRSLIHHASFCFFHMSCTVWSANEAPSNRRYCQPQVTTADVYTAVMDWFEHLSRPPQQQSDKSKAASMTTLCR